MTVCPEHCGVLYPQDIWINVVLIREVNLGTVFDITDTRTCNTKR